MTLLDETQHAAVSRRTFLRWLPRQMVAGVRELIAEGSPSGVAGAQTTASVGGRRLAVIDVTRCLAWGASPCQACYLRCPLRDEAIMLDDGRPLVMASACNGCGVCVEACRTVNDVGAIRLALDDNLNHTPSPGAYL